jgi:hypothetical protein
LPLPLASIPPASITPTTASIPNAPDPDAAVGDRAGAHDRAPVWSSVLRSTRTPVGAGSPPQTSLHPTTKMAGHRARVSWLLVTTASELKTTRIASPRRLGVEADVGEHVAGDAARARDEHQDAVRAGAGSCGR